MTVINILVGSMMFFFTKTFAVGLVWFIARPLLLAGVLTSVLGAITKMSREGSRVDYTNLVTKE